jgi:hypothetical protein
MMQTHKTKNQFFLVLCAVGIFAILSSTMSKNPVLNPFAESIGTPQVLMGLIAAASTLPGIRARELVLFQMLLEGRKSS